jgi:hypothetical protein
MWVASIDHQTDEDPSLTLTVDMAGVEVVSHRELLEQQPVRGVPVEVARTAHYRINCTVRQQPVNRPFDLVLESARLAPVSLVDAEAGTGTVEQGKQAVEEHRIME